MIIFSPMPTRPLMQSIQNQAFSAPVSQNNLALKVACIVAAFFICGITLIICKLYWFKARKKDKENKVFENPIVKNQQKQIAIVPQSQPVLPQKMLKKQEVNQENTLEQQKNTGDILISIVQPFPIVQPSSPKNQNLVLQELEEQKVTQPLTSIKLPEALKRPSIILAKDRAILARLQKNRNFAEIQQKQEKSQNFNVFAEQISIKIGNRPLEFARKIVNQKQVGMAHCQGLRNTMEDADLATQIQFKVKDHVHQAEIFGIFDGHGGAQASAFLKKHLAHYLTLALESQNQETLTEEGVFKALKACFKQLDEDYQGDDGSTATIAFLLYEKIWIANVGDSRTILVKEGITTQASEDATPNIPRYRKKIEDLGGKVSYGRINGQLAVARAIGDKNIIGFHSGKCCVSPMPKITNYPLAEFKDGYLVLACDGLYDVASSDDVGKAVQLMAAKNMSPRRMAANLVYHAIRHYGSSDNVSAMVVKL